MEIDNNHVTKLGELKQLIDGLWDKVTTAISNAVSGLLSKSEASETYAKKGEIPTVPTNVSSFENDAGYITEAEVPQYELTADKIEAVGELSNNTSGLSDRSRRVIGYGSGNSAANIYGFKIATITSASTTNTCGFEAIISLKRGSNAGNVLMIVFAYMRGSTIRLSGRVISGSNWDSSLVPLVLSAKSVTDGFDIYLEHPALVYSQINVTPLGGRSSGADITYHSNQQLTSKLTGQASTYTLYILASSNYKGSTGSPSQPVYVNEDGGITACNVYYA